jgi:hypothetical protein
VKLPTIGQWYEQLPCEVQSKKIDILPVLISCVNATTKNLFLFDEKQNITGFRTRSINRYLNRLSPNG